MQQLGCRARSFWSINRSTVRGLATARGAASFDCWVVVLCGVTLATLRRLIAGGLSFEWKAVYGRMAGPAGHLANVGGAG